MGGRGSGRKPEYKPAHRAGIELLKWATERERSEAKPLVRLGLELGVDTRTIMRWLLGKGEPSVTQALAIERLTGVSVGAWEEKCSKR